MTTTQVTTPAAAATATNPPSYQALLDYLAEINGQDFYDAKLAAVGSLSKSHYLKLPTSLMLATTDASMVGRSTLSTTISDQIKSEIYVLNKDVFDGDDHKVKGALLRLELVLAGWCEGAYEVEVVAPPADALNTMYADLDAIKKYMPEARKLAILLPLAAEHTFRTMGHHYITNQASDYNAKYARFFNACVASELTNYLPADLLYHRVAHWVSMSKAMAVANSADQIPYLPHAVVIRARAAPAGSALVTTSAAVIQALSSTGLASSLTAASGVDTEAIIVMADKVKANAAIYHVTPFAYGKAKLTITQEEEFEAQKKACIVLAPVLQGFLDTLPKNSDLASAKALAKHADINPLLRKRAKAYFREVGVSKAATMTELFAMDKRSSEAVGGEEMVEE